MLPKLHSTYLGPTRQACLVRGALLLVIVFAASHFTVTGQTATPSPSPGANAAEAKTRADKIKRWLSVEGFTVSSRYRYVQNRAGRTVSNQLQYQLAARGRLKFDEKGRYSLYAGLFTGNNITSGWNNTGWGTGDAQTNLYLKHLYFNAKPAKWLEVQFGSLGVNNGENTEITGLDNDVYLTGERVQVRSPKNVYFDEISVTYAYLGDNTRPNAFRRLKRLDESNYHQFLVRKQINKRVAFSADYTFESGRDTLHQAVNIKTPELRVLDRVHFENYQRVDPDHGYGFSLYGEKKLHDRFTLGGGFARIDRPMLNADRFPPGNRLYLNSSIKLTREFALSTAVTQAVGSLPSSSSVRTRVDVVLTYNFLETLRQLKLQ